MSALSDHELAGLVEPDRVHRRVYTDPAVFALERERLFARAWLYVGHESQVPKPGDFLAGRLDRDPILLTRHKDGALHVLRNRCAHRGAKVCLHESGNAPRFQCPYHGWTYDSDGALFGVPSKHLFPEGFAFEGLARVPRVASYRGFVFASQAATGPALEDWLGGIRSAIDNMVDRAPDGELEIIPGVQKHVFRANWKMQIENLQDAAHPAFVHESSNYRPSAEARREQRQVRGESFMAANAVAAAAMDRSGIVGFPYGHSYLGGLPVEMKVSETAAAEYRRLLVARHGEAKTAEILGVDRHQQIVYPTVTFQSLFQTVKTIHPLAVDRTEINAFSFRLKGAPDEYHQMAITFLNVTNSAASPILADDMAVYESAQEALAAPGAEWVNFAAGRDQDTAEGNAARRGRGLSELAMRNQFAAWRDYMLADARREAAE
ncbi:MAG TPA: Rieske 2Fe-2S domain-containing protein [Alphaproteobacteria bacterium]|nr:Rieske 2Fe-2S domain-containing protein [Alphaproteobacteria bacterium]